MLIYERLTEELLKLIPEMIRKHEWHFPTEMELCSEYGVSRRTVRRVLDSLEKSGFIKRRQGSGCYLTGLLPDDDSNRISILLSSPKNTYFLKSSARSAASLVPADIQWLFMPFTWTSIWSGGYSALFSILRRGA